MNNVQLKKTSSSTQSLREKKQDSHNTKNNQTQTNTKKRKNKQPKTQKRKKWIIEPSSTSSHKSISIQKKSWHSPKSANSANHKTDIKNSLDIEPSMTSIAAPVLPCGRLNETFIELMESLSNIMLKHGEPFKARAYQKAQETIMTYPSAILSPNDLKGKPGIGYTIMEKLNEYMETGTLKLLEREKHNPVTIFTDVYGIGPKKAKELVEGGITSISQLRENPTSLNDIQKVGLTYYEDLLKRIPRSEIEEYKTIFQDTFQKVAIPDSQWEIVGSYRRGAQTSGDIDVILTSHTNSLFQLFVDSLLSQGIIEKILSRGPSKCLVIAKLPHSETSRRVDFLYTTLEEFPFAILYFTGSKVFNTVMRHQALQMGWTMNEHGLYTFEEDGKKKGNKVDHVFHQEKDIFDFLHMQYKAPEERIDGRAVVLKSKIHTPQTLQIVEKIPQQNPQQNLEQIEKKVSKENMVLLKSPTMKTTKTTKTTKTMKKKASLSEKTKKQKKIIIESDSPESKEEKQNSLHEKEKTETKEKQEKQEKQETKEIIDDFKKKGISILKNLDENQLSAVLKEANQAYYNQEPVMTDNEFDIVKEYIEQTYPSNQIVLDIGAPVERNKVTLPYFMGSMDKIKPDTAVLENWMKKYKGPYVLSCKLDGVSGLYTTEGPVPKLYTRGDGKVGQDISHLIPYLRLPKTQGIVIRGEFILPKIVFETKYKTLFANPRNMVAGLINHKSINEAMNDLHFVAYEVIQPSEKPSEQMSFLSTLDVEIVLNETRPTLSNETLSNLLVSWRQNYIYEIDGVIVAEDAVFKRKPGNPEHAFAFKMVLSDQIAEAKVVDILWTPSKDGYLKPRVQIEPIHLGGVRIEYATGFNAAFIYDNKIGIGSVIEIIRSGDVIPHIRKVTVPAEEPKMPSVPYQWNETHIDVLLENIGSDETVKEKVITGFFKGIGVEGLSSGNISRIIHSGFDTIPKILNMTVSDFLTVDGFKEKTATKLYNGIREKIQSASLISIMSASNLLGRGFSEKKMELILDAYPDVLISSETNVEKSTRISEIKGMAKKSAEAFVERIAMFISFLKEAGLEEKLHPTHSSVPKIVDTSHPLFGKTIVMTGFRDATIQEALKKFGAKIGSSVSKHTFLVLVKNIEEDTGKVSDAKKIGIPLMTPEEFKQTYM